MTIAAQVNAVASGDNTLGHVVTAAGLGTALAEVTVWVLQLFQIPPPDSVALAMGTIMTVLASWILKRMSIT